MEDRGLYEKLVQGRTLSDAHIEMIKRVMEIKQGELVLVSRIHRGVGKLKGPVLGVFDRYEENSRNFLNANRTFLNLVFAAQPYLLENITLPGNVRYPAFLPKKDFGYGSDNGKHRCAVQFIDRLAVGKEEILRELENGSHGIYSAHAEFVSRMREPYIDPKMLEYVLAGNG